MVVLSYSVIYYIYIPGTLGPCFHYWCSVYGICKWSDTLWPVGRVRLFADYTISLSSLCRLIWKHWTTKMLVRYMMPSVCLRLRQFSQLSLYSLYGARVGVNSIISTQLQLQLQRFQLQLQLRPISRISTPTPTPTPGVSTPTPTPANLQNINSNSNSNSGSFNSNSNSNSGDFNSNSNSNSGVSNPTPTPFQIQSILFN